MKQTIKNIAIGLPVLALLVVILYLLDKYNLFAVIGAISAIAIILGLSWMIGAMITIRIEERRKLRLKTKF